MKLKSFKHIFIVALSMFFISNCAMANDNLTQNDKSQYVYDTYRNDVEYHYANVSQKEWKKYFENQTKQLKKQWAKETILKDDKYKTSYARVLFFIDNKGEILSYQIKSSCIPKGDKEFFKAVERTISNVKTLNAVPQTFKHDMLVYTVKFNSYLPKFRNYQNVDWNRYGVADIEISKNASYVLMQENR